VGDKDFIDSFALLNIKNDAINNFEALFVEQKKEPSFELMHPDIDINEVNADYDELFRKENELCDDSGIGIGYSYSSEGDYYVDYDGGYDSY
jgi:hypothetical protein